MSKSRESLAENMVKLESLRDELERANGQLDDAHRAAERQRAIVVEGVPEVILLRFGKDLATLEFQGEARAVSPPAAELALVPVELPATAAPTAP